MRSVSLLGFLCLCSAGLISQEKPPAAGRVNDIRFTAEQTSTDNGIITMKGNVRVSIGSVSVYADEAEYNTVTGDLTPQGHVRIRTREFKSSQEQQEGPTDTPLRMPPSPWRDGK